MKDRVSKYPGRVKLTPVDGQANTFDMIRADEPEEAGTPINKNSLLKDETAKALGLDPAANPTPDDAFKKIVERYDPKVGDILETVRDDPGAGWLACDGTLVTTEDHQKLYDELPYNTEWRVFDRPSGYNRVRPTRRPGEWVFLNFGSALMPAANAKVYNASTETWTDVSCPSVPTDYRYGIFGLTWDGSSYIMGVMEDSESADYIGTMYLFTSTDLKNWTQKYSFKNSANYMQGYDLTSDGENTIIMEYGTTYVSPSNHYAVYFVNREMTNHTQQISNSANISGVSLVPAPDGYWAYNFPVESGDGNYDAVLFYKGNTYIMGSYKSSNGALAFFSDRYVMTVGGVRTSGNTFGASYCVVADLETGTSKTATWDSLTGLYSAYMNYCEYDKTSREWLFIIKTLTTEYYAAYISEDSDPSVAANYRVVRIEALPEREYNDQMSPDRAVIHNNLIRDPNLKYLPSHEDGGIRRYIYEGVEGEQSGEIPSPDLYATDPNAVHYYRDEKTEEQKAQARENIGAGSKSIVDDTTKTVYFLGIDNGIIYLEEV